MNFHDIARGVEFADDCLLAAQDRKDARQEAIEDEVRETVELINILDELSAEHESILMNRLLMCRKNAAHDVFEILSDALDRSIKAQVSQRLKGQR